MIHDICKKISKIEMKYKIRNSNRTLMDTPGVLYSNYIGIVVGLPDDTSKWSLHICTTYFSALVVSLSGLLTKKLQVQALHQVPEAVVKSLKALNDEEKRMCKLMGTSGINRGSMNLQESIEINQQQHNTSVGGTINCAPSQSDSTWSRYTGGRHDNSQYNPHKLPWRMG